MDTLNQRPLGKDIYSKMARQVNLEGNDPRSSAGFQLIQQHALEHSSMEFSDDESLVNALAGSFNTSEDFRRVGRWAEGVCKGTRLDPARLRNLPQNDSPLPIYHPEFTRIRPSSGQTDSTDMSSVDATTTACAQQDSIVCSTSTAPAGNAKKRSVGVTLVRQETLLTPAAILRQKQMNNFDRRSSEAQRARPSSLAAIDLENIELTSPMVVARPKSRLTQTATDAFNPETFSTPVHGARTHAKLSSTNSSVAGPSSISPVLIQETPVTATVQMTTNQPSAQPHATPLQVATSAVSAPKSTTKQSKIPQWARDSVRRTTLITTSTVYTQRLPVLENATPRSTIAPNPLALVSNANLLPGLPPVPAAVDKSPTPLGRPPTVTFNLTVNNTPAASAAPQLAQLPAANANGSPVNSNRVSSTMKTNKQVTIEPMHEILLTDDEDDNHIEEARQPPMWKAVASRHATPGVHLNENRRSEHTEPNKSLRRQLFQPGNNSTDQSQSIGEQPQSDGIVNDGDDDECVLVNVGFQRGKRSQARNLYETHSIANEQSTSHRPLSVTYDKERASLQNYTYDVVSPRRRTQPIQNTTAQNASESQTEMPESSGIPSEVILHSIDNNTEHDVMSGAHGGNDSTTTASSTSSNFENIPKMNTTNKEPNTAEQSVRAVSTMKSPESTTPNTPIRSTPNRLIRSTPNTPIRSTRRSVLAPLSRTNNHSVRLPSLGIATSTTNALRDSETFSSVLPPPNFQDDQIITEHSPTVVRQSIEQIISLQKNKSHAPLSLSNRSRGGIRRKAKTKSNAPTDFNDSNDSNEQITHSQNGRRTLYTKGNSDCEDNEDAVGNEISISHTQPSTSRATPNKIDNIDNRNIAGGSNATGEKSKENASVEEDSVSANATEEPLMTTMDDGGPHHLSDIIEASPIVTGTKRTVETAAPIEPQRTEKSTRSKAKTKTVPKRAQKTRNTAETKASTSTNTERPRRSNRSRNTNPWTAGASVYEIACQKALGKRKASPVRTKEPEPEIASGATKKRRIAEKTNQVAKVQPKKGVPKRKSNSKTKNERKKETLSVVPPDNKESKKQLRESYIHQIAKDIEWFNDLCNKQTLPTFVNQEGVYKIHTNRLGSVKIESTSFGQVHYFPEEKIDYGFFPGVVRMAGVMRFHKGAVKATSTTENSMELEVLHGSFELWQGKQTIEVMPGLIMMQPGTSYGIKYTGRSVGVILFHIYEKGD